MEPSDDDLIPEFINCSSNCVVTQEKNVIIKDNR